MTSPRSILLASTALLAIVAAQPFAQAETAARPLMLAQKQPDKPAAAEEKDKDKKPAPQAAPQAQPKPPAPQAQPQQAQPQQPRPQEAPPQQAQPRQTPPQPAPAVQAQPKSAPAAAPAARQADERREQRRESREDRREERRETRDERREQRRETREDRRDDRQERRETQREDRRDRQAPAAASKPAAEPAKQAAPQQPASDKDKAATTTTKPAEQEKPAAQSAPAAQPDSARAAAAPPPPDKPRDASEFILRRGENARRSMDDLRRSRRETRDGDRVVIREGDRTIVRDGNRTIIRHNEADRFAIGARDVEVQRRGDLTTTVVVRPNGVRIITVTDRDGHLVRRVRRDARGREIVIIDNSFRPRRDFFVDVRPPRIRDRGRYIIEAGRARPAEIYEVFLAPPIERLERRYTLDEVRYSAPLRDHMPRVDLDINFETGSWQLSPEQIDRLAEIAAGLNRAIDRNPREVFLIEGHTDAVGSDEDNLSLSDRRAEAVAVALTEQFEVPAENLVTQGYGEEYPKVQTEEAARENRRVAVRRVTPLIAQAESQGRR